MSVDVEFTCSHCGQTHEYECDEETPEEAARNTFRYENGKVHFAENRRIIRFDIDGVGWITNGHILVRADSVTDCIPNKKSTPEMAANAGKTLVPYPETQRVKPARCGSSMGVPCRELLGLAESVYLDEKYYSVFAACDEWRAGGALTYVQAFLRGRLQGVVMPMRVGSFTVD